MGVRPRIWLVTEFHCHFPQPNLVSLWISGRPLSPDRLLEEDVARKLIGPVPDEEAKRIVAVLRAELQAAGIDVHEEFSVDD